MDINEFRKLANAALADYDFGDVRYEDAGGWEYNSNCSDVTCAVFLKFPEDSIDDDTHVGTFYVSFKDGKVDDVSCHCEGSPIGKV